MGLTNNDILNDSVKSDGTIIENRLLELIGNNKRIHRTISVPNPSAQNTSLCEPVGKIESIVTRAYQSIRAIKAKNPIIHAIAEIQLMHGVRVSEVLQIKGVDLIYPDKAKIVGLKGSENRIINLGECSDYLMRLRGKNVLVFQDVSRFYVYREYKKMGFSLKFAGRSKASVTHLFRHLVIKNLKNNNITTNESKKFIGHKSEKSTEIYEK